MQNRAPVIRKENKGTGDFAKGAGVGILKSFGLAVRGAPMRGYFHHVSAFWHFFWGDFFDGGCVQSAAALAYTTLLSMVPFMAVSLSIFAAFPVFDSVSAEMQDFVFKNFVPASGEVVQDYIQGFSDKAKKLTGPGIVFLMITAVMMMATIEKGFNRIWRVSRHRTVLSRFYVYWSVLTLGPLMMGVGMVVSSYVISMPLFSGATASMIGRKLGLLKLVPFFMEVLTFTLLYAVVPNIRVPWRNALTGGVLAALLFELAKFCFTYYITNFPTYETIYGALAAVPIFLVWVYLSWIVAMVGAEFAYALEMFQLTGGQPGQSHSNHDLGLAFRVLKYLWQAQKGGRALELEAIVEHEPEAGAWRVEQALLVLRRSNLVARTEQGEWLLARDMSGFRLLDLYRSHPYRLPAAGTGDAAGLGRVLAGIEQSIEVQMAMPLAELFQQDSEVASNAPVLTQD